MRFFVLAGVLMFSACAMAAPAPVLKSGLEGLGFLVGDWQSGAGIVADTGGTATGTSRFTVAAGGAALLRQDHTDLVDRAGKAAGGFDQVMLIYPEGGTLHAEYADGSHLIHYVKAEVEPGKSATFSSAEGQGAPVFRLTYTLEAPGTLSVAFGLSPAGSDMFRRIASGTLHKVQ